MNQEKVDKYIKELSVGLEAVRKAAKLCVEVQKNLVYGELAKRDRSPVTIADFGSQALICSVLREAFPQDSIIAEEDSSALCSTENNLLARLMGCIKKAGMECTTEEVCRWIDYGSASEYCNRFWTVDPIDGTKGFLRGEQYAVVLSLFISGEPVISILGCPEWALDFEEKGAIFYAVKDSGAFCEPLEGGSCKKIQVSSDFEGRAVLFCESVESSHSSHAFSSEIASHLEAPAKLIRFDSQVKYAAVASGVSDAYLRLHGNEDYRENIWDHAAMLLVTEAGGTVSDIEGNSLDFKCGKKLSNNRGIIAAASSNLHNQLVDCASRIKK